jgi:hypothetical protein
MGNHGQPIVSRAISKGELFGERQLRGPHGLARSLWSGAVAPQVSGFDFDLEGPAEEFWNNCDRSTSRSRLDLHGVLLIPRPVLGNREAVRVSPQGRREPRSISPRPKKLRFRCSFVCALSYGAYLVGRRLYPENAQTIPVGFSDIFIGWRTGSIPTQLGTAASCGSSLSLCACEVSGMPQRQTEPEVPVVAFCTTFIFRSIASCRCCASLRELNSGLDDCYRGAGASSLDLVFLSNYSRRYARHACSSSGDDIGRSPWSDPIFGVQDSDPQKGEPLIVWAFGVVRTLLDAPQFLCLLRIPNQAALAAESDIHIFS